MLHVTCYMLYVIFLWYILYVICILLCYICYVICYMLYVLCYMLYVICYMLHVICSLHNYVIIVTSCTHTYICPSFILNTNISWRIIYSMKKSRVQRENIKLSIKIGKLSNCLTRIRILSIYAFQKMVEPGCS